MTAHDHRDEGRVLILVIGCVLVLALLVAVTVDAARLYLTRRGLDGVTDGAALAGVQALDLDAIYRGSPGERLPIDEEGAVRAVDRYLAAADVGAQLEDFEVTGVDVGPTEVTVRARAVVHLPFVGPVTDGRRTVVVRSEATARNVRR